VDFIERYLGFSPDHGDERLETMLLLELACRILLPHRTNVADPCTELAVLVQVQQGAVTLRNLADLHNQRKKKK
jgi:hypothetical protein